MVRTAGPGPRSSIPWTSGQRARVAGGKIGSDSEAEEKGLSGGMGKSKLPVRVRPSDKTKNTVGGATNKSKVNQKKKFANENAANSSPPKRRQSTRVALNPVYLTDSESEDEPKSTGEKAGTVASPPVASATFTTSPKVPKPSLQSPPKSKGRQSVRLGNETPEKNEQARDLPSTSNSPGATFTVPASNVTFLSPERRSTVGKTSTTNNINRPSTRIATPFPVERSNITGNPNQTGRVSGLPSRTSNLPPTPRRSTSRPSIANKSLRTRLADSFHSSESEDEPYTPMPRIRKPKLSRASGLPTATPQKAVGEPEPVVNVNTKSAELDTRNSNTFSVSAQPPSPTLTPPPPAQTGKTANAKAPSASQQKPKSPVIKLKKPTASSKVGKSTRTQVSESTKAPAKGKTPAKTSAPEQSKTGKDKSLKTPRIPSQAESPTEAPRTAQRPVSSQASTRKASVTKAGNKSLQPSGASSGNRRKTVPPKRLSQAHVTFSQQSTVQGPGNVLRGPVSTMATMAPATKSPKGKDKVQPPLQQTARYVGNDVFGNYNMMANESVLGILQKVRPNHGMDANQVELLTLRINHFLEDFFAHNCNITELPYGFISFSQLKQALIDQCLLEENATAEDLMDEMKQSFSKEDWKRTEGILYPSRSCKEEDTKEYPCK